MGSTRLPNIYTPFLLVHTGHNHGGDAVTPTHLSLGADKLRWDEYRTNPLRSTQSVLGLESKYQRTPRGTNIFTDLTARRGSHEVEKGGLVSSDWIIRTTIHPRQAGKA